MLNIDTSDLKAKNLDISACFIARNAADILDVTVPWACNVFPQVNGIVADKMSNNDDTVQLCETLEATYPNLKIKYQPWNGVFGQTFQQAYDMCDTEYLLHFDADEMITDLDWSALLQFMEDGGIDVYSFCHLDLTAEMRHYMTKISSWRLPRLIKRPHVYGNDAMHTSLNVSGRKVHATDTLDHSVLHFTLVKSLVGLYYKGMIRGLSQGDRNLGNPTFTDYKNTPQDHEFVVRHRIKEWEAFMAGNPVVDQSELNDVGKKTLDRWIPKHHPMNQDLETQKAEYKEVFGREL